MSEKPFGRCVGVRGGLYAVMLVLGLGLGFKDNICGLGLVGEKQNFNIVCRLYEVQSN